MRRHHIAFLALASVQLSLPLLPMARSQDVKNSPTVKAKPRADINSLMKELFCVQSKGEGKGDSVAIWLPYEAIVELMVDAGGKKRAAVEEEYAPFKGYQMVIASQLVVDKDGTLIYATQQDLESRAMLKLETEEEFPLVDKTKIPQKLIEMAEDYKRVLTANEGGEFSKSSAVLFFSSTARDGKTKVDTSKKNRLILIYNKGGRFETGRLEWKTPFDATNPVPPCAKCTEPL